MPFVLRINGRLVFRLKQMDGMPPFNDEEKRREFLRRLNDAVGTAFPDDAIQRRPNISLALLTEPERLAGLLAVFDWFLAEVKHHFASA
jgi:hypothetical protein